MRANDSHCTNCIFGLGPNQNRRKDPFNALPGSKGASLQSFAKQTVADHASRPNKSRAMIMRWTSLVPS